MFGVWVLYLTLWVYFNLQLDTINSVVNIVLFHLYVNSLHVLLLQHRLCTFIVICIYVQLQETVSV